MTIKDLFLLKDIGKRIKIISSKNKELIGKKGTLTNAFRGEKKIGLFLDIPLKNECDTINLSPDIEFSFTQEMF
jgi:hypothetical protein